MDIRKHASPVLDRRSFLRLRRYVGFVGHVSWHDISNSIRFGCRVLSGLRLDRGAHSHHADIQRGCPSVTVKRRVK